MQVGLADRLTGRPDPPDPPDMSLLAKVRRYLCTHDLVRPDTRVVCALSGGSDSVALATIAHELHQCGALQFVGLTHLNHQLRSSADRDERFCRELADRLRRPILIERGDVAAQARRHRQSIEAAAHDARYGLFARARRHFAADVVALGHTRDDQAETFLLRLLRGAGPRGLAAMHPRHGDVVRPLLDCSRAELRDWLTGRQVPFVEDESNADIAIPRNRLRAELIPRLAADFNPNIVEVLAREAEIAREVWAWLDSELARFEHEATGDQFDVERLLGAPPALRRLALWRAMNRHAGARLVDAAHVQRALDLLAAPEGSSIHAPGVTVHRIGSRIVLKSKTGPDSPSRANHWQFPLSIPGEVATSRMVLSAEFAPVRAAELDRNAAAGNGPVAAVRGDLFRESSVGLAVRNRRPGDRFQPAGLRGRKKLQDFFVDRKIARADRDLVPIVVDDRDRIVWVAGHRIDEAFRVTDASQGMVVLKLRYLGSAAPESRGGDPLERSS